MRWTVLVELECELERLPDAQLLVAEMLEVLVGARPTLKTIQSDHLQIALRPPDAFQQTRGRGYNQ